MDEQTTQPQETQQQAISQENTPPAQTQFDDAPQPATEQSASELAGGEQEPDIYIQNGEVKFKEDFFDDMFDSKPEEEKKDNPQPAPQPQQPNLYSPDELRNIPFEQWDRTRLPSEITAHYDEVQRQIAARQAAQQRAEQMRNAPMPNIVGDEPKSYTPKELVEASNKLAMERLGVKENDFDPDYDAEHRAAVDIARADLIQQRNFDIAAYRQRVYEVNELREFNSRLVKVPDFEVFSKWYDNALRQSGKTNEQIQTELAEIAHSNGTREVIRIMAGWYNLFKQQSAQQTQQQVQQQAPKPKAPPRLESTRGGDSANRKTYNMRDFGQLDDDAQAQALLDMGII